MLNSTDRLASEQAEKAQNDKAARRAEEASIIDAVRQALLPDEQLLGFARGVIAGGIKGRLNIGPEAFFAPFVNIGLTERRLVLQHLHGETGRVSEILPHFFSLADINQVSFADIETFGGTPASRLVLLLANGQSFRLRLTGAGNCASARALADVFKSLTASRSGEARPTQTVCASCGHILDRPAKFCPYCGAAREAAAQDSGEAATVTDTATPVEKVTVVVAEQHRDLLDDALEFLRNDAPEEPAPAAETPQASTDESAAPAAESETEHAGMQPDAARPESGASEPPVTDPISSPYTEAAPASSPFESPHFSAPETPLHAEEPPVTGPISSPDTEAAPASSPFESPRYSAPETPLHAEEPPVAGPISSPNTEAAPASSPFASPHYSAPEAQAHAEEPVAAEAQSEPEAFHSPFTPPAPVAEGAPAADVQTVPTSAWIDYSQPAPQAPSPVVTPPSVPVMPIVEPAPSGLRVHFKVNRPPVVIDEVMTGRDADEVVAQLKDRVLDELKFPIKLVAMRLTTLELAQEIVARYNQAEKQSLPRPNSCMEFLRQAEALGFATVEQV